MAVITLAIKQINQYYPKVDCFFNQTYEAMKKNYILVTDTSSPFGSLVIASLPVADKKNTPSDENQHKQLFKIESACEWGPQQPHSEWLTVQFQKALESDLLDIKNISALVVGKGPGSFTGLRVAINFIKTLGYALSVPIYAFNSLEILAYQTGKLLNNTIPSPRFLAPCIYAFSQKVFIALYQLENKKNFCKEVIPPQAIPINKLKELLKPYEQVLFVGNSVAHINNMFHTSHTNSPNDNNTSSKIQSFDKKNSPEWLYLMESESNNVQYPSAQTMIDMYFALQPKSISWKALNPFYIRPSSAEEKLELQKP